MKDLWTRFEAWLSSNAPDLTGELRPGAYERALATLERNLGLKLPDDLRASLAIHDGAEGA